MGVGFSDIFPLRTFFLVWNEIASGSNKSRGSFLKGSVFVVSLLCELLPQSLFGISARNEVLVFVSVNVRASREANRSK